MFNLKFCKVNVNSKYFRIKEFLNLDLNDNSLNLFHVNIASLDKYLDDLHNLLSIIKLQIVKTNQEGCLPE